MHHSFLWIWSIRGALPYRDLNFYSFCACKQHLAAGNEWLCFSFCSSANSQPANSSKRFRLSSTPSTNSRGALRHLTRKLLDTSWHTSRSSTSWLPSSSTSSTSIIRNGKICNHSFSSFSRSSSRHFCENFILFCHLLVDSATNFLAKGARIFGDFRDILVITLRLMKQCCGDERSTFETNIWSQSSQCKCIVLYNKNIKKSSSNS